MYLQCDPDEPIDTWSDDRIWTELQARVGGNGYTLQEGPITDRSLLRFRSNVCEPMQYGRLLLVGDAAHMSPLLLGVGGVQVRASQGRRGRDTGSYLDRGERREVRAWASPTVKRLG